MYVHTLYVGSYSILWIQLEIGTRFITHSEIVVAT